MSAMRWRTRVPRQASIWLSVAIWMFYEQSQLGATSRSFKRFPKSKPNVAVSMLFSGYRGGEAESKGLSKPRRDVVCFETNKKLEASRDPSATAARISARSAEAK